MAVLCGGGESQNVLIERAICEVVDKPISKTVPFSNNQPHATEELGALMNNRNFSCDDVTVYFHHRAKMRPHRSLSAHTRRTEPGHYRASLYSQLTPIRIVAC